MSFPTPENQENALRSKEIAIKTIRKKAVIRRTDFNILNLSELKVVLTREVISDMVKFSPSLGA
jgi:hypothetical protein